MEPTRVYDTSQVDAYVARLHQQIDALNDQLATLQDRLALPTAADDTEAAERILGRVLLRAQQVADDVVAEGRRERDEAVAEGRRQRDEVLGQVERQCQDLLEAAERDAAVVTSEARRQRDTILSTARSEAAALIAEAEEEAKAIVYRAEEAREMQALVDEVRRTETGSRGPRSTVDAKSPHQVVAFPWARPGDEGAEPDEAASSPAIPVWVAAAPPTGAPVIPLAGAGEPAPLPATDAPPDVRADARRAFPFRH
jgi:vacuolar-type H+-ATPase subunit H